MVAKESPRTQAIILIHVAYIDTLDIHQNIYLIVVGMSATVA